MEHQEDLGAPPSIRVLLSAYACEPGRGSEPGLAWGWAWHLAQAGLRVTVLTKPGGRAAIEEFLATHEPKGEMRFEYLSLPPEKGRTRGLWRSYERYFLWQRAAYEAAAALAQEVDIVHHVSWGAILGGSQLWRLDKPYIFGPAGGGQSVPLGMLGLMAGDWPRVAVRQVSLTAAAIGVHRKYVADTACFLATNRETAALAARLGARRIEHFIDTGVDERFLLASPPTNSVDGPLRVLWVGRLLPRKAAILAVTAISLTRNPLTLTIVGDGPLREDTQRAVDQLGLGQRVTIKSWVPWEDMPAMYQSHDAFLFTSLLDSFGGQLLEAMASGLPVVALDHQGAGSFVSSDQGVLVKPTTPKRTAMDLAKALDQLADDVDLRSAQSAASWRHASSETWERRAQRMISIYEKALRS